MSNISGIINLYKEQGFTSNDCVNIVRGIFDRVKTGHTGTLDPMATGVLPICLGKATKLADYIQSSQKVYRTVLRLGIETDTCDIWGRVLTESNALPERDAILDCISGFAGEQEQTPPMYSAIRINGKRLYELARQGKTVERKSRHITIFDIYNIEFLNDRNIAFTVKCSKGTYIRALCADIGKSLGTGGCMAALERLESGAFCAENAVTIGRLKELKEQGRLEEAVIPVEKALAGYKKYRSANECQRLLENGNKISVKYILENKPCEGEEFLLYDYGGCLVGIFKSVKGMAKPVCMLR